MRRLGPIFRNRGANDNLTRLRKELSTLKRSMQTTGQRFGSRSVHLPDGSIAQLIINLNGPRPIFIAREISQLTVGVGTSVATLYLESGILDLTSWRTEGAAGWYIGNEITLLEVPDLNPTAEPPLGELTVTTSPSVEISGDKHITDFAPSLPSRVTSASQKKTQISCPASLYSGLLRRYVQAVYGSKIVSYSLDDSLGSAPAGTTARLILGDAILSHKGTTGHILFRSADLDYFLIQLSLDSLVAYPLTPVAGFADVAPTLKTLLGSLTGNDFDVAEQIYLSILAPSSTDTLTASYAIPAGTFPIGEPLFYSWKGNSDGSKARAIFLTFDNCAQAVGVKDVELSISYDTNNGFSVSVSANEALGKESILFLVWTPEADGTSYITTFYPCAPSPGCTSFITGASDNFDISVYGWYDKNDVWTPVEITQELNVVHSYSEGSTYVRVCGFEFDSNTRRTYGGARTTHEVSITCGDADASVSTVVGNTTITTIYVFLETYQVGLVTDGLTLVQYITYDVCDLDDTYPCLASGINCSSTNTYYMTYETALANAGSFNSGAQKPAGTPVLIIPWRDCEAAVVACEKIDSAVRLYASESYVTAEKPPNMTGSAPTIMILDEVKGKAPDGSIGDTLWSGSFLKAAYTDYSFGPYTNYTLYPTKQKTIRFVGKEATEVVVSQKQTTNGGSGGGALPIATFPEVIQEIIEGISDFPVPGLEYGGAYGDVWDNFMNVPYGVCSVGNRWVPALPTAQQSAVFLDKYLPTAGNDNASDPGSSGYPTTSGPGFVGYA